MFDSTKRLYTLHIDQADQNLWDGIMRQFDDACIYQTYSYGRTRWSKNGYISSIYLKRNDIVVSAALFRIVRIPILGPVLAYCAWGPIWKRKDGQSDLSDFNHMLESIVNEYANKRKLYVRLKPSIFADAQTGANAVTLLERNHFYLNSYERAYRTLLVDIAPDLETIRMKTLSKKWREKLNRSLRNELEIEISTSDEAFEKSLRLYEEMYERKEYARFDDIYTYRKIQRELPDDLKINIGLCKHNNKYIAFLAWAKIGNQGISLFSATANAGLRLRGSYLLRWTMFENLKDHGLEYSDQGGIDPENNPGGYEFRHGLGGRDVSFIGTYDTCTNITYKAFWGLIDMLRSLQRRYKVWRHRIN